MSNRSETFGRLLKGAINSIATYEGKTAPTIEEDLAEQVGLAGSAIQRYKSGYLPPESRTIEIIAEAAVRRGYLYREWLQRFLHAARYHQTDRLLDRLCPIGPTRPRPPCVYENLPAPTYSQFVMRPQAFAEVLDGLGQRSAAVLVVGMGGNGKTSLAREVAARCLKVEDGAAPHFDAAVWVSDKDRPGTTNLSTVLDEIARTLDYPGFTQFEFDEKRREVEQLLRRQRVLLVVDNFETITDSALLSWLLRLPEPSKALLTSREYSRAFRNNTSVAELRGMSEDEIRSLIDQRLRVLRIEKLVGSLEQLEPLIAATGGNPKAIEITLGLVKHERRPLQQILDDLYAARGELFVDLFARAWTLLDDGPRRILLVTTFFPMNASSELLGMTADVQGFSLHMALERLADLALLDVQQTDLNSPPRYMLHPLVKAFAEAKLKEQSPEFTLMARQRGAKALILQIDTAHVPWAYANLDIVGENDLAGRAFLDWTYETAQWSIFLDVYKRFSPYWAIRGLYDVRLKYALQAVKASEYMQDVVTQIRVFASLARLKSYLGDYSEAIHWYSQVERLCVSILDTQVSPRMASMLTTTQAILAFYQGHTLAALEVLCHGQLTNGANDWDDTKQKYWIGRCHYALGDNQTAQVIFRQVLDSAERLQSIRIAGNAASYLAALSIRDTDAIKAEYYLNRSYNLGKLVQDRRQMATFKQVLAQLYSLRGDLPAARTALVEAIDLFERLGMRRELAEARAELARLDDLGGAAAA